MLMFLCQDWSNESTVDALQDKNQIFTYKISVQAVCYISVGLHSYKTSHLAIFSNTFPIELHVK